MSFENMMSLESKSRKSTEEDSSSDKDEEVFYVKTNPLKHKTELCKTFSELGYCPYEQKCRFAHGKHELVHLPHNTTSKSKKCNGFWKNGFCPYGLRCQFGHAEVKWEDRAILYGLQATACTKQCKLSKLIQLIHWNDILFIMLHLSFSKNTSLKIHKNPFQNKRRISSLKHEKNNVKSIKDCRKIISPVFLRIWNSKPLKISYKIPLMLNPLSVLHLCRMTIKYSTFIDYDNE